MKLFIVEPVGTGGMIHYSYQLATAIGSLGHEVTLVTAQQYELETYPHNFKVVQQMNLWTRYGPVSDRVRRDSTVARVLRTVFRFARRVLRGLKWLREWTRLTRYILRQRPDVVQFGAVYFPIEALWLTLLRRRGITLACICHEFESRERSRAARAIRSRLYAAVYPNFSAIFLHGEANRQRFLSLFDIPPQRVHVIPHGNESLFMTVSSDPDAHENLRERYGLNVAEPVILFFGHLTPSKGVPDLINAFGIVRQSIPAKLLVTGFPSKFVDVNELKSLAENLGLGDGVVFDARYIPIDEVGPIMKLASVVAFPYRSATASGSLQLAYAFGRPVVATSVGSLSEVVEDGRSGFLVPPEDPEELAQALMRIVEDPQLAKDMGAHASHLSETRYSWKSIAAQILSVYNDLLDNRPPI